MSVKRKELIKYLLANGCFLKREGSRHSIYSTLDGVSIVAVPRHNEIKVIVANEICKQADLKTKF